jgi:hypothetical protein
MKVDTLIKILLSKSVKSADTSKPASSNIGVACFIHVRTRVRFLMIVVSTLEGCTKTRPTPNTSLDPPQRPGTQIIDSMTCMPAQISSQFGRICSGGRMKP